MTNTHEQEPQLLLICTKHGQQGVYSQGVQNAHDPARTVSLILQCGCEFLFDKCKPAFQANHVEDGTAGMGEDGARSSQNREEAA